MFLRQFIFTGLALAGLSTASTTAAVGPVYIPVATSPNCPADDNKYYYATSGQIFIIGCNHDYDSWNVDYNNAGQGSVAYVNNPVGISPQPIDCILLCQAYNAGGANTPCAGFAQAGYT